MKPWVFGICSLHLSSWVQIPALGHQPQPSDVCTQDVQSASDEHVKMPAVADARPSSGHCLQNTNTNTFTQSNAICIKEQIILSLKYHRGSAMDLQYLCIKKLSEKADKSLSKVNMLTIFYIIMSLLFINKEYKIISLIYNKSYKKWLTTVFFFLIINFKTQLT